MMQQAIFRPQPAFMQPQMAFQRPSVPERPQFGQPQGGQLQGSSGPNPPSLEEVLSQRGFTMPEKPRISSQDMAFLGTDPVTGRMRQGGSTLRPYYKKLDELYAQNPEALEIAKQYTADPSKFGGEKPTDRRSVLSGQLNQTIQPPTPSPIGMIQRPGGSALLPAEREASRELQRRQPDYGQQVQEMQAMMREMMQMISALSNRGGFGGYSPRQQMMFGGIGSIPMSRGMFY